MTDEKALGLFQEHLRAGNQSVGTVRLKLAHLSQLRAWLGRGLLTARDTQLRAYLASHEWAPETRKSQRSTIRSFYSWAFDEGLIESDPARRLPAVRIPQTVPKPIPEQVLADALARADRETWRMLVLGAYAGLRRSEIAQVHSDDVTPQGLRVQGKGGRVRVVPMHPLVVQAFDGVHGWMFPSPLHQGRHVNHDYIRQRMDRILPRPWTTHTLRHRFASRAYTGSRDLRAVQTLLGHSKPETTARYVLVTQDSLVAAVGSL